MYNTGASNFSEGVDLAFKIIFGIGIFFLTGITLLIVIFVIRYREKKHPKSVQIKDNTMLEIIWTVIPVAIVLLMFYYGYIAYSPMRKVPKDAINIKAIGRMWEWSFVYKGEKQSSILVVPLNKPVRLNLVSLDVNHSLYIPAFRIKEDLIPGKNNYMWFIPEKLGEYEILCSQYCGLRHSYMESKVRVISDSAFRLWLNNIPKMPAELPGLTLIKKNGCTGCHSLDGSKIVSTSFKGLYGKKREVITGGKERTIIADDEYILRLFITRIKTLSKVIKMVL